MKRLVTCGVSQGSVLGLLLGCVAFNGIFKVRLPPGVKLICYADDILMVCTAETILAVERRVNRAIEVVTRWIESARLELAVDKTVAILFTTRRKSKSPTFRLQGVEITTKKTMKCLGI